MIHSLTPSYVKQANPAGPPKVKMRDKAVSLEFLEHHGCQFARYQSRNFSKDTGDCLGIIML